jgi:hypothetical protein
MVNQQELLGIELPIIQAPSLPPAALLQRV